MDTTTRTAKVYQFTPKGADTIIAYCRGSKEQIYRDWFDFLVIRLTPELPVQKHTDE